MLTYGDGLTDQNLNKLEKFHLKTKNCNNDRCKASCKIWRGKNEG